LKVNSISEPMLEPKAWKTTKEWMWIHISSCWN
jgi:hypothetical protein